MNSMRFKPTLSLVFAIMSIPILLSCADVEAQSQCDVRGAQEALSRHGLDPGPIDGQWGSRTSTAVAEYQQQKGLPITRQLDKNVCDSLGLAILRPVTTGKKEWGIVSPENCFWECVQLAGCKFETHQVTQAGAEDEREQEYWLHRGVGGIHPLLGPVKINGVYYQPIVLSGTTRHGSIMTKGSRWVSDPHGIHLGAGWQQRCSAKAVETSEGPLIIGSNFQLEWIFHEPIIVAAILDRMLHRSIAISISRDSYLIMGKMKSEDSEEGL